MGEEVCLRAFHYNEIGVFHFSWNTTGTFYLATICLAGRYFDEAILQKLYELFRKHVTQYEFSYTASAIFLLLKFIRLLKKLLWKAVHKTLLSEWGAKVSTEILRVRGNFRISRRKKKADCLFFKLSALESSDQVVRIAAELKPAYVIWKHMFIQP